MASADDRARMALHRFGLGGTPPSRAALTRDPRDACLAEIKPEHALIKDVSLPKTARAIQIISEIEEKRRTARQANRMEAAANAAGTPAQPSSGAPMMAAPNPMPSGTGISPALPNPDELRLSDVYLAEMRARLEHGIALPVGFAERWVMFWSNHFCIATRRGQFIRATAGAYEREAIRPHVFGHFMDLLLAAEAHPAMLHYLDQRQSVGPNSPAGQRRSKGLNENLAREILELHTLGVGGGYKQADVTNFAKVLTGWTITGGEENLDGFGGFLFGANRHEPGPQTVLGKLYAQGDEQQGKAVLRDLAAHPSTAKFIALKLARHFVADKPPASLVTRLETEFLRTKGDLAALAKALITAPESWSLPPTKLRTPMEFVAAMLRATDQKPEKLPQLNTALTLMGQPLWDPPGPNGHADDETSIAAPKAIKTRLDLALQFARPLTRIDPRDLAGRLFGDGLSNETWTAIARAETRPQGLALLLMSPEFQRR